MNKPNPATAAKAQLADIQAKLARGVAVQVGHGVGFISDPDQVRLQGGKVQVRDLEGEWRPLSPQSPPSASNSPDPHKAMPKKKDSAPDKAESDNKTKPKVNNESKSKGGKKSAEAGKNEAETLRDKLKKQRAEFERQATKDGVKMTLWSVGGSLGSAALRALTDTGFVAKLGIKSAFARRVISTGALGAVGGVLTWQGLKRGSVAVTGLGVGTLTENAANLMDATLTALYAPVAAPEAAPQVKGLDYEGPSTSDNKGRYEGPVQQQAGLPNGAPPELQFDYEGDSSLSGFDSVPAEVLFALQAQQG